MDKGTRKTTKQTRKWNPMAVKALSEKYRLSQYYIRTCLTGWRQNETANTIRREYRLMLRGFETVINNNKVI